MALEGPHFGRQGRHLSIVSDLLRARDDGSVPQESLSHQGRAAEEHVAEGVCLMADAAPARSAGDVGAMATFCAGVFADPVKVLLGPGPVPGTELMYINR